MRLPGVVLAILSTLLATVAQADDFRVAGGDPKSGVFKFIDLSMTDHQINGVGSAWFVIAWMKGRSPFGGVSHSYVEVKVDCDNRRSLFGLAKQYDKNGVEQSALPASSSWEPVTPETTGAIAFQAVCRGDTASLPKIQERSAIDIAERVRAINAK